MIKVFAIGTFASILLTASGATAKMTNDWVAAEIQGRQLAQQILEQQPAESFTNTGVLKIHDRDGKQVEIPVRFEISVKQSNWQTIYSTHITNTIDESRTFSRSHFAYLTVVHSGGQPNRYVVLNVNPSPADTNQFYTLEGNQLFAPFAGSDFWIADLGLEFLHWPEQRILKHEMRRGRACRVLESRNPNPSPNGYSRVVSWIDNETLGIVQAEAYDAEGKLLKEFYPRSFKKVNGQWELQEMEIRNDQTGSRTRLEFNSQPPD